LIWAIFVDAASGRSIAMFLEEGALEKNLATGSATIAFALTKRKGSDDLLLAEVCADETAELALRLPRAKLRVLDGALRRDALPTDVVVGDDSYANLS
jgi:hypothetical protein